MRDIKTEAIVLRRTNYGESDRILDVLTPEGKIAVLAKGVRKEKSKLAGGIEMFSLSSIVAHYGKSELAILTAARSKEFFKGILSDFSRLETASEMIKKVDKAAEQVDSAEYFSLLLQALRALDKGKSPDLILTWFYLNYARISGEQVNLYTDTEGSPLAENGTYAWNSTEKSLRPSPAGKISAPEIKMLRLMLSAPLELILKVKNAERVTPELLFIAKSLLQL